MLKFLLFLTCLGRIWADLRRASQPKDDWKVQQRNRDVPFQQKFALYMEPSAFNYQGLENQRDGGGYDNFLRSNIDNEQDRRNFNTEDGKDHLPFRTYETAKNDAGEATIKHRMVPAAAEATDVTEAGNYIPLTPGEPYTNPLRWNNPHSAELEVNIWIMNKAGGPYVIPIKKPTCSGEGYQDNVHSYTVPSDFNSVASCRVVGDCVLQVYSHSVESRMYASGTPVIVAGGQGTWNPSFNANTPTGTQGTRGADGTFPAQADTAWELDKLRRLCLPSSAGAAANWAKSYVYQARLSSDVYNHAYQNSDFSPYAGQQPQHISQNMQASCILKMAVGNFGELGKEYMHKTAREARDYAGKLDKKARALIRNYETVTDAIINAIKENEKETTVLAAVQQELGSTECLEWRDQYQNKAYAGLGRVRGTDRSGGFCAAGLTCLCHHDCYGEHQGKPDAYCAQLEAGLSGDTPIKTEVVGTEVPRIGFSAQKTETCFRCPEVGSTVVRRLNTNTYIPSFEIHGGGSVNMAIQYIAPMMLKSGFLTNPNTGKISKQGDERAILQIYMSVLGDMWPEFKDASTGAYLEKMYPNTWKKIKDDADYAAKLEKYQFTYRGPVLKTTTDTLSDANGGVDYKFKKLNADGAQDKGYYSAAKAWSLQNRETGSSTAQPTTAGPLNSILLPQIAHNDKEMAPCDDLSTSYNAATCQNTQRFVMPPALEIQGDITACARTNLDLQEENLVLAALDIGAFETDEKVLAALRVGQDMDGLNRDADCDDAVKIAAHNLEQEKLCEDAIAAEPGYKCVWAELACVIPGATGVRPGQMFTNDEEVSWMNSAEASGKLSVTFFLAVVSAFISLF